MKHTPGKWNVETWIRNNGQSSEIVIVSNKTDAVASACPLWRPNGTIDQAREEEAANARLIAAAPELLEALKNALARMEENKPAKAKPRDDMHKVFARAVFYRDLEAARAAIAKATDDTETARAAYFDAGQPF